MSRHRFPQAELGKQSGNRQGRPLARLKGKGATTLPDTPGIARRRPPAGFGPRVCNLRGFRGIDIFGPPAERRLVLLRIAKRQRELYSQARTYFREMARRCRARHRRTRSRVCVRTASRGGRRRSRRRRRLTSSRRSAATRRSPRHSRRILSTAGSHSRHTAVIAASAAACSTASTPPAKRNLPSRVRATAGDSDARATWRLRRRRWDVCMALPL